jgi:hypothetical protein
MSGQAYAYKGGKAEVFVRTAKDELHLRDEGGHFRLVNPALVKGYQGSEKKRLTFTRAGLAELGASYETVRGMPQFVHRLLQQDHSDPRYLQMLHHPHLYPYFADENFLIIPNTPLDGQLAAADHPRSQKLDKNGIALVAWFIHPHSSSLTPPTLRLLRDLASGPACDKPAIQALRDTWLQAPPQAAIAEGRDARTIGELRCQGEYLASLLDLNGAHIPLLARLKEKALAHLNAHYGVNEHDRVELYFHFPYPTHHVTLHLHIRANQGFHPLEQAGSFTIDQLIDGLSRGKVIEDIILDQQRRYGGFYRRDVDSFQGLEGIVIENGVDNPHRLSRRAGTRIALASKEESTLPYSYRGGQVARLAHTQMSMDDIEALKALRYWKKRDRADDTKELPAH